MKLSKTQTTAAAFITPLGNPGPYIWVQAFNIIKCLNQSVCLIFPLRLGNEPSEEMFLQKESCPNKICSDS